MYLISFPFPLLSRSVSLSFRSWNELNVCTSTRKTLMIFYSHFSHVCFPPGLQLSQVVAKDKANYRSVSTILHTLSLAIDRLEQCVAEKSKGIAVEQ